MATASAAAREFVALPPVYTLILLSLHVYACTCSALRDSRFSPVQIKEVSQLSCSVSLLRCFEQGASWHDWEIGQHGLIIEFTDPVLSCKRTATFLPEVAGDQGWSKQQCIEALIRKAGECSIRQQVAYLISMS
eukprot:GHRQ01037663.1.p1 GENE.GHRQ01037663.1~~GHRQ01037663.1.p1  ORF type:complete len:134 (+),score=20.64 GHRQ01037663.1:865-1266(+)